MDLAPSDRGSQPPRDWGRCSVARAPARAYTQPRIRRSGSTNRGPATLLRARRDEEVDVRTRIDSRQRPADRTRAGRAPAGRRGFMGRGRVSALAAAFAVIVCGCFAAGRRVHLLDRRQRRRAREPRRLGCQQLYHRREQSHRGGRRRPVDLLGRHRQRHDRAREPDARPRSELYHHRRDRPVGGGGRRPADRLGQLRQQRDRAREPERLEPRMRALSRARPVRRRLRSTASTSTGPTSAATRSGARTLTARAQIRALSPASTPRREWRSTASTCTGRTL